MSSSNLKQKLEQVINHQGLKVKALSINQQLERVVLACLLYEDNFYIDGKTQASLIADLVAQSTPGFVADLAIKARKVHNLRHVPLHLLRELARHGKLKAATLTEVISRPDELGEFLAIYWKDGKVPLSNQVKLGLANAMLKFNEYQFAKWDKNSASVRVRDVMFMVRPKPTVAAQEALFKAIANDELKTPDTWETELSAGKDKRETFARLMAEKKLGALAFLRNLRNMTEAGVSSLEIETYAQTVDTSKVLPFRYTAAYRAAPSLKNMLGRMMQKSLKDTPRLPGKTVLLVDVSGSMASSISAKSDLSRQDAAAALAILCRGICEEVAVYTFANRGAVKVNNPVEGFDLADQITNSQPSGGTNLALAVYGVNLAENYDRILVFTDEMSSTRPNSPKNNAKGYILNVAGYQHGINHDAYVGIDGFSESVVRYIQEFEKAD